MTSKKGGARAYAFAYPQGVDLKYRELIRLIEDDGWRLDRQRGSHMQYRHPNKPGTVTVAAGGRMNDEVPTGTRNSILRQAGLR